MPVLVAAANQADAPIFIRRIGTVQALNAITVKSRVNGDSMVEQPPI